MSSRDALTCYVAICLARCHLGLVSNSCHFFEPASPSVPDGDTEACVRSRERWLFRHMTPYRSPLRTSHDRKSDGGGPLSDDAGGRAFKNRTLACLEGTPSDGGSLDMLSDSTLRGYRGWWSLSLTNYQLFKFLSSKGFTADADHNRDRQGLSTNKTAKDAPAKKPAAKKVTRADPPAAPGVHRVSGAARCPSDARSWPNPPYTTTTVPSRSSVFST